MSDIMAKGKSGAPSATRSNYMAQCVLERLTNVPTESFSSAAMKWGTETEPKAREFYAFMNNVEVSPAPYVPHPTILKSGGSPDSFVGTDGLLEIKCPLQATHMSTLLGSSIDNGYMLQMQWCLACTGRLWCDYVSFDPRFPTHMQYFCKRVHRDSAKIIEMQKEVIQFLSEVDAKIAELKSKFPFPLAEAAE